MFIEFPILWSVDRPFIQNPTFISLAIEEWADKFDIAYRTKVVKSTLRLTFDEDRYYNLFSLTWDPKIPFRLRD